MMFVYRTSLGSQWLSKEDLEKLTVEKLSEHEVNYLLNIFTFNVYIVIYSIQSKIAQSWVSILSCWNCQTSQLRSGWSVIGYQWSAAYTLYTDDFKNIILHTNTIYDWCSHLGKHTVYDVS